MSAKRKTITDPVAATRIVDALEKQASKTGDLQIKRLLLAAGCEILDHVVRQQTGAKAA